MSLFRYRNPFSGTYDHKRSWWTTMLLFVAAPAMAILALFIPEVDRCRATTTRIRRRTTAMPCPSSTNSPAAVEHQEGRWKMPLPCSCEVIDIYSFAVLASTIETAESNAVPVLPQS
uniref:Secreted protein n=1 Tax=Panagrellus redivivus TaxID=6233 RepID=A0A7E4W4F6_PANRE